jgi:DNA-binding transcriptional regulator YiaG
MTFAEILKEMRLELGLSQPVCAAHLGVSRRTLQYWEAGEERHIPHVLMQEGALARLLTLLTNQLNSADSALTT